MSNIDPFKRYVATPESPSSTVFMITPSDSDDLPVIVKRLRVFNSLDEIAFLAIVTVGGSEAILPIPPLTLIWEDILTARVLTTGTTDGLTIHGLTY